LITELVFCGMATATLTALGTNGGVGYDGPSDPTKQAYGHAFVLLAASSAKAVAEEFTREWQLFDCNLGQNSNMHPTESLMAAFEATSDSTYLHMAERIANLIIGGHATANGWRVPEHFTNKWVVDRTYAGSPMLRPYGTTSRHSLEWSRLLLRLWELGGRKLDWLPQSSKALFAKAVLEGWDKIKGGFYYTLDWNGNTLVRDRYWWPWTGSAFLNAIEGDPIMNNGIAGFGISSPHDHRS
jgi:sulfoquinovose isomerase